MVNRKQMIDIQAAALVEANAELAKLRRENAELRTTLRLMYDTICKTFHDIKPIAVWWQYRNAAQSARDALGPDTPPLPCTAELPYPAPRCGVMLVKCSTCGLSVGLTVAGRPDDPRSVKVACKRAVH